MMPVHSDGLLERLAERRSSAAAEERQRAAKEAAMTSSQSRNASSKPQEAATSADAAATQATEKQAASSQAALAHREATTKGNAAACPQKASCADGASAPLANGGGPSDAAPKGSNAKVSAPAQAPKTGARGPPPPVPKTGPPPTKKRKMAVQKKTAKNVKTLSGFVALHPWQVGQGTIFNINTAVAFNPAIWDEAFAVKAKEGNVAPPKEEIAKQISILQPMRATTIELGVKRIFDGADADKVVSFVREFKQLPPEVVNCLLATYPKDDEKEALLKTVAGKRDLRASLAGRPEGYQLRMIESPEFPCRLAMHQVWVHFEHAVGSIHSRLDCVKDACREVASNQQLPPLLQHALTAGNHLNKGSSEAPSNMRGFHMRTLWYLQDFKHENTTFVEVLTKSFLTGGGELPLKEGLCKAADASAINMDGLSKEIKSLYEALDSVREKERSAHVEELPQFLKDRRECLKELKDDYEGTMTIFNNVVALFHGPAQAGAEAMAPHEFFTRIVAFGKKVDQVYEQIEEARVKAQNRAAAERARAAREQAKVKHASAAAVTMGPGNGKAVARPAKEDGNAGTEAVPQLPAPALPTVPPIVPPTVPQQDEATERSAVFTDSPMKPRKIHFDEEAQGTLPSASSSQVATAGKPLAAAADKPAVKQQGQGLAEEDRRLPAPPHTAFQAPLAAASASQDAGQTQAPSMDAGAEQHPAQQHAAQQHTSQVSSPAGMPSNTATNPVQVPAVRQEDGPGPPEQPASSTAVPAASQLQAPSYTASTGQELAPKVAAELVGHYEASRTSAAPVADTHLSSLPPPKVSAQVSTRCATENAEKASAVSSSQAALSVVPAEMVDSSVQQGLSSQAIKCAEACTGVKPPALMVPSSAAKATLVGPEAHSGFSLSSPSASQDAPSLVMACQLPAPRTDNGKSASSDAAPASAQDLQGGVQASVEAAPVIIGPLPAPRAASASSLEPPSNQQPASILPSKAFVSLSKIATAPVGTVAEPTDSEETCAVAHQKQPASRFISPSMAPAAPAFEVGVLRMGAAPSKPVAQVAPYSAAHVSIPGPAAEATFSGSAASVAKVAAAGFDSLATTASKDLASPRGDGPKAAGPAGAAAVAETPEVAVAGVETGSGIPVESSKASFVFSSACASSSGKVTPAGRHKRHVMRPVSKQGNRSAGAAPTSVPRDCDPASASAVLALRCLREAVNGKDKSVQKNQVALGATGGPDEPWLAAPTTPFKTPLASSAARLSRRPRTSAIRTAPQAQSTAQASGRRILRFKVREEDLEAAKKALGVWENAPGGWTSFLLFTMACKQAHDALAGAQEGKVDQETSQALRWLVFGEEGQEEEPEGRKQERINRAKETLRTLHVATQMEPEVECAAPELEPAEQGAMGVRAEASLQEQRSQALTDLNLQATPALRARPDVLPQGDAPPSVCINPLYASANTPSTANSDVLNTAAYTPAARARFYATPVAAPSFAAPLLSAFAAKSRFRAARVDEEEPEEGGPARARPRVAANGISSLLQDPQAPSPAQAAIMGSRNALSPVRAAPELRSGSGHGAAGSARVDGSGVLADTAGPSGLQTSSAANSHTILPLAVAPSDDADVDGNNINVPDLAPAAAAGGDADELAPAIVASGGSDGEQHLGDGASKTAVLFAAATSGFTSGQPAPATAVTASSSKAAQRPSLPGLQPGADLPSQAATPPAAPHHSGQQRSAGPLCPPTAPERFRTPLRAPPASCVLQVPATEVQRLSAQEKGKAPMYPPGAKDLEASGPGPSMGAHPPYAFGALQADLDECPAPCSGPLQGTSSGLQSSWTGAPVRGHTGGWRDHRDVEKVNELLEEAALVEQLRGAFSSALSVVACAGVISEEPKEQGIVARALTGELALALTLSNGLHWQCIFFDAVHQEVVVFDPFGDSEKHLPVEVSAALRATFGGRGWKIVHMEVAVQSDTSSCGIFCDYAKLVWFRYQHLPLLERGLHFSTFFERRARGPDGAHGLGFARIFAQRFGEFLNDAVEDAKASGERARALEGSTLEAHQQEGAQQQQEGTSLGPKASGDMDMSHSDDSADSDASSASDELEVDVQSALLGDDVHDDKDGEQGGVDLQPAGVDPQPGVQPGGAPEGADACSAAVQINHSATVHQAPALPQQVQQMAGPEDVPAVAHEQEDAAEQQHHHLDALPPAEVYHDAAQPQLEIHGQAPAADLAGDGDDGVQAPAADAGGDLAGVADAANGEQAPVGGALAEEGGEEDGLQAPAAVQVRWEKVSGLGRGGTTEERKRLCASLDVNNITVNCAQNMCAWAKTVRGEEHSEAVVRVRKKVDGDVDMAHELLLYSKGAKKTLIRAAPGTALVRTFCSALNVDAKTAALVAHVAQEHFVYEVLDATGDGAHQLFNLPADM